MEKISENIEKIIRVIAVLTFIGGFLVSLRFIWEAIDYSDFDTFLISIAILVGSFVTAVFIFGFSITIEKLKENVSDQKVIIRALDNIEKKLKSNVYNDTLDIVQSNIIDECVDVNDTKDSEDIQMSKNNADLEKCTQLLNSGAITQEEFDLKQAELINIKYEKSLADLKNAETVDEYEKLNIEFNEYGDFKNSKEYAKECQDKIEYLKSNYGTVRIKLESNFLSGVVNSGMFIKIKGQKEVISGMKHGDVLELKVGAGNCILNIGNSVCPIIDSLPFELKRFATVTIGVKSTLFSCKLHIINQSDN